MNEIVRTPDTAEFKKMIRDTIEQMVLKEGHTIEQAKESILEVINNESRMIVNKLGIAAPAPISYDYLYILLSDGVTCRTSPISITQDDIIVENILKISNADQFKEVYDLCASSKMRNVRENVYVYGADSQEQILNKTFKKLDTSKHKTINYDALVEVKEKVNLPITMLVYGDWMLISNMSQLFNAAPRLSELLLLGAYSKLTEFLVAESFYESDRFLMKEYGLNINRNYVNRLPFKTHVIEGTVNKYKSLAVTKIDNSAMNTYNKAFTYNEWKYLFYDKELFEALCNHKNIRYEVIADGLIRILMSEAVCNLIYNDINVINKNTLSPIGIGAKHINKVLANAFGEVGSMFGDVSDIGGGFGVEGTLAIKEMQDVLSIMPIIVIDNKGVLFVVKNYMELVYVTGTSSTLDYIITSVREAISNKTDIADIIHAGSDVIDNICKDCIFYEKTQRMGKIAEHLISGITVWSNYINADGVLLDRATVDFKIINFNSADEFKLYVSEYERAFISMAIAMANKGKRDTAISISTKSVDLKNVKMIILPEMSRISITVDLRRVDSKVNLITNDLDYYMSMAATGDAPIPKSSTEYPKMYMMADHVVSIDCAWANRLLDKEAPFEQVTVYFKVKGFNTSEELSNYASVNERKLMTLAIDKIEEKAKYNNHSSTIMPSDVMSARFSEDFEESEIIITVMLNISGNGTTMDSMAGNVLNDAKKLTDN